MKPGRITWSLHIGGEGNEPGGGLDKGFCVSKEAGHVSVSLKGKMMTEENWDLNHRRQQEHNWTTVTMTEFNSMEKHEGK